LCTSLCNPLLGVRVCVSTARAFASHRGWVACRGPCCAKLIAHSALRCCGHCSNSLLFVQICLFRFLGSDVFVQIRRFVSSDLFVHMRFFRFDSSDLLRVVSSQRLAHAPVVTLRGCIESVHQSLCYHIVSKPHILVRQLELQSKVFARCARPLKCFVVFLLPAPGLGSCYAFVCSEFLLRFVCSDLFANRCSKFVCLFSFASICWLTTLSQICLFRLLRLAQIRLLILACSALFCKELFRFQMDLLVHIRLLRFVCPECFLRFVCSDLFAKICSVWFAQIRFLSFLMLNTNRG
jgi:hypothetical protein